MIRKLETFVVQANLPHEQGPHWDRVHDELWAELRWRVSQIVADGRYSSIMALVRDQDE